MVEEKIKRKAKQIRVDSYDNIFAKIGTVEDKMCPETVFINVSFWVHIKDDGFDVNSRQTRQHLEKKIKKEFDKKIIPLITSSNYFTNTDELMLFINIPDSINSNKHNNFVDIELFLFTINTVGGERKYSLNTKRDTELYDECLKICDSFSNFDVLSNRDIFLVKKKSN